MSRPRPTSRSAPSPPDFTKLPTVSFVVPNLCNDLHDYSIATGDTSAEEWGHLAGWRDRSVVLSHGHDTVHACE